MLCVTGNECTGSALATRLAEVASRFARQEHLQEVRLDALREPLQPVLDLIRRHASRVIVTCRPRRQGGGFEGGDGQRLEILRLAAGLRPAYVDLEGDLCDAQLAAIRHAGARSLILSWHVFEPGGGEASQAFARLAGRPAEVLKLATVVEDASELATLHRLGQSVDGPTVLIGMGQAGMLSRCRYRSFGAPWTYVCSGAGTETARGQLSIDDALQLGLPKAAEHPFFCLIGGAQIADSPGPRVYNRLFRQRNKPWSYLPVVTSDAEATLDLLRRLGVRGVSVTMPHKHVALSYGQADATALAVGAANSLHFSADGVRAINTDVEGVRRPLSQALAANDLGGPQDVLILGAGGAARAAAAACRDMGLRVAISARRLDTAADIFSADVLVPWAERADCPARILINATAAAADNSPWPSGRAIDKAVVFDLALSARPSALLSDARQEGSVTIEAQQMWLAQGAAQMQFLSGESISEDDLRRGLA